MADARSGCCSSTTTRWSAAGLRTFLEVQDDIEVVGEAADGAEGVARAEELRPDVILMDVKMPGIDGIEALRKLRELGNPARVLVVTSFTEQRTVVPALRAGAAGYVYKDVDPDALAGAIRSVHAGHVLLQPEVAGALLSQEEAGGGPGARRLAHRAGARGARPDRRRPLQPGDRPRAGAVREDREDPRVEHPDEARPRGPHPGRAVGRAPRHRRLSGSGTTPGRRADERLRRYGCLSGLRFIPSCECHPDGATLAGSRPFSRACCGGSPQ